MGGFSLEQALTAQRALRSALGLGEEVFPVPAFVGMISDEIEQMRDAGHTNQDILDIIRTTTGQALTEDDLQRHYAPPGARRHGHEPRG